MLEEKLDILPSKPGVYLMKGKDGKVLYIGKAKNLRSRVRSYFHKSSDTRYTVQFLVSKAFDIDFIVTANEKEALILEDTLLKKFKPRYNIRLKDDKTYVSIKLTVRERFPRILVTRRMKDDGSRYFGPYASAQKVRETIKFLRGIFPLRTCGNAEFNNRVRPCLDFQIGLCGAPAAGHITENAYMELVSETMMFLEGRNLGLVRILKKKMADASRKMDFERAASIRDQIASIEETLREQRVVSSYKKDQDIFAYAVDGDILLFQVMFIRGGRLVGGRVFSFKYLDIPVEEFFSSFLSQYYSRGNFVPNELILPLSIGDRDVIQEWLTDKKGTKVAITKPIRGIKVSLLKMAEANAKEALKKEGMADNNRTLLEELKRRLRLSKMPKTIDAFDISNISGKMSVGAMVSFVDGKPDKKRYRLFKIRLTSGPDDYSMMREVMQRRYIKAVEANMPDLILVDGGKGQLNIALKVFEELGVTVPAVAAIAKDKETVTEAARGEKVYLPFRKDPIILKEDLAPDNFMKRVRDEAHRFAITYHRRLRSKGMVSMLEDIPGVGPKRRKALLIRFDGLEGLRNASLEEISAITGINQQVAALIKEKVHIKVQGSGKTVLHGV